MIDLVRRHVVILASVVLGWSGYSFYDAGSAKPEAQAKGQMTEIGAKFLALRDPAVRFEISSDPYRFDHPAERPAGHAPTAAASAAHADAGWDDGFVGPVLPPPTPPLSQADLVIALAGALRLANEALARGSVPGAAASGAPGAPVEPPRAGFVLVLQSTLDMRTGGQARINGRTVEEGDEMPFLDALDPPVLERVQGSSIVVSHDGQEYLVDLLENPVLQVGLPATAEAAVAAPASAPAKTSAPSASPKPASATGGPPSPGGGKKGTYRVRGKSSKKP